MGDTVKKQPPSTRTIEIDAALVDRAKQGDEQAMAALIEKSQDSLFRFFCYLSGDRLVAEDLCQETYIRALEKLSKLKDSSAFPSWLFKTGKNLFLDYVRGKKKVQSLSAEDTAKEAEQVKVAADSDVNLQVQQALSKLAPEERLILILVDMEGHSYQETAEIIGVSEAGPAFEIAQDSCGFLEENQTIGVNFSRYQWLRIKEQRFEMAADSKIASEAEFQELETSVQSLLRGAVQSQPATPAFMKTRVLAVVKERQNSRKRLRLWQSLAATFGAACLLVVVAVSTPWSNGKHTAMLGHAFVVKVELEQLSRTNIRYAEVQLPDGVHFYSERYPEIANNRTLKVAWDSASTLDHFPFVVRGEKPGTQSIKIRFLGDNDAVMGERLIEIRFKERLG